MCLECWVALDRELDKSVSYIISSICSTSLKIICKRKKCEADWEVAKRKIILNVMSVDSSLSSI